MKDMRKLLWGKLEEPRTPGSWNRLTDQTGMFACTGLTEAPCQGLMDEFHVYLLKSGRFNVCGVTPKNMEYVVKAIQFITSSRRLAEFASPWFLGEFIAGIKRYLKLSTVTRKFFLVFWDPKRVRKCSTNYLTFRTYFRFIRLVHVFT